MTSSSPSSRVHRELDIAPARLDADLADHRDRRIAHRLILAIGERHRRRDGDRIARMHAHRIDVLDRAHDHHVVRAVAHHLELVLLPAEEAALNEHLIGGRQVEPAPHDVLVLVAVVRDAAAGAAERERRPNDRREAHDRDERDGVVPRARDTASGHAQPDTAHRLARTARDPRRAGSRAHSAPMSSTPYFSSTPLSASSSATLSAVWPPIVGSSASGRSRSIICSTTRP